MSISPLDVIELLDPTPDELKYALARALEEADEVQVAHDRFRVALVEIEDTGDASDPRCVIARNALNEAVA